jgi:cation diffusion facilitator CzcD-associated flavoprotein CzcO
MSEPKAPQPSRYDVAIVGAGILGINALYELTRAGFSVRMIEAGSGVGGAWYWNRYPEARFDSESYTYAYLFSKELFDEWRWSEHFAGQPEIERYLNHVVDRFDLRRHITFGTRIRAAHRDEATSTWTLTGEDGTSVTAGHLVAATGVLSIPYQPDVPGQASFRGQAFHTGRWPKEPVDFSGKRVAVVGTGSSGIQLVPAIAPSVESLTVYQRGANWATPLNNEPITEEKQAELRADFESLRQILLSSDTGFMHTPSGRGWTDDTREERQAFFEKMWKTPGFGKLVSNYENFMTDPAINELWTEFVAAKIRARVHNPVTAEALIPKDHRFGGKRPPMETNYYEAYNRANVSLVDLRTHPIVRMTETGIATTDGQHREFDIVCWATGFDFGTGALSRIDVRGRAGRSLADCWADGPVTFAGTVVRGVPSLYFPGGPHGTAGNNPRYGGDQVEFVRDLLIFARDNGYRTIEVKQELQDEWMDMVERFTEYSPFVKSSFYFGGNIPGKPSRMQQNPGGRAQMMDFYARAKGGGYQGFEFQRQ